MQGNIRSKSRGLRFFRAGEISRYDKVCVQEEGNAELWDLQGDFQLKITWR